MLADPDNLHRIGEGLDMHGALREVVAAQMCGRWRNGVPYELSPDAHSFLRPKFHLTNFDYTHGSRCPAGSHLRRANPRVAVQSFNALRIIQGDWCVGACRMGLILTPKIRMIANEACWVVSLAQISRPSSRQ